MKTTILFITTLIILALFNIAIYQKEAIVQKGQPLLFKLITMDPQTMIQDDKLYLRYAIEDEMRNIDPKELQKNSLAVIKANDEGVVHFQRLYNGELKDDERLVKYYYQSLDPNPVHIKPDSFAFQDEFESLYEKAHYAIFHYHGAKDYVLTGIADSTGNEITQEVSE